MNVLKSSVAVAAMLITVVPTADAQRRSATGREASGGGQGTGRIAVERSAIAPRPGVARPWVGASRYAVPRVNRIGGLMTVAPAGSYRYNAAAVVATAPPRLYSYGAQRGHGAVVVGRAVPRGVVVASPVVHAAPGRFYRPYYTFRPRVSVGLGLWLGFPVRYPYFSGYYNPYYYAPYGYGYPVGVYPPYAYPAPYPAQAYPPPAYQQPTYPPPTGTIAPQAQSNAGGMSFEITPATAEVYVDGRYIGTANDFSPTSQPLGLAPGRHQIEIRAEGYRTMIFDADIVAGEVLPYRGALSR